MLLLHVEALLQCGSALSMVLDGMSHGNSLALLLGGKALPPDALLLVELALLLALEAAQPVKRVRRALAVSAQLGSSPPVGATGRLAGDQLRRRALVVGPAEGDGPVELLVKRRGNPSRRLRLLERAA